jgi:membrane fusion protein (multidrug efflux system)
VVAFVPASDAPQIQVGMPLRLELTGYAYAYLELKVARFAKEATGARAVSRQIGPQLEDAIAPGPATVLVEADLPGDHFEVDGRRYPFREGMPARAEIRLRSEPILFVLVPWLRTLR